MRDQLPCPASGAKCASSWIATLGAASTKATRVTSASSRGASRRHPAAGAASPAVIAADYSGARRRRSRSDVFDLTVDGPRGLRGGCRLVASKRASDLPPWVHSPDFQIPATVVLAVSLALGEWQILRSL